MPHLEPQLIGFAGEYLVAGELSLRGYLASITLRNSKGIDIIASNSDGSKSISIQVKTNSDGKNSRILNKKSENFFSKNHFYIFVATQKLGTRPDFYIVPSEIVAEYISTNHQNRLKGKKRDGSDRKDSNMRKFSDEQKKYLEKRELLNL